MKEGKRSNEEADNKRFKWRRDFN